VSDASHSDNISVVGAAMMATFSNLFGELRNGGLFLAFFMRRMPNKASERLEQNIEKILAL
jgi:hypothetical protein